MKKLKRANLAELAKSKTIISFLEQRRYVGGGSGTQEDPFTYDELMSDITNNSWSCGWVQGVVNNGNAISYCGGTGEPMYVSANLMYKGGTGPQANTIYDGGTLGYSDKTNLNMIDGGNTYNGSSSGGFILGGSDISSAGWNPDKAIKKLRKDAGKFSIGKCAGAVMNAIEAGGETSKRVGAAHQMNDGYLANCGFEKVSKDNYIPQKGDIIVIEAVSGHKYGHTAMYDGKNWISDFYQRDAFGGSAYRKPGVQYDYYRHK